MKKNLRLILFNLIFFLLFLSLFELIFGHWFKKNNFGIHMRNERNKNWQTTSVFNDKEYNFYYKRNFYGFRGEEFNPKNVKIIFNGGSTSNQRYTPEELTIVGRLNKNLENDKINAKIFNAGTNGKSLRGIIYDFKYWFSKIENLKPNIMILYLGINERTIADDLGQKNYDIRIKNEKIDQIKDFIKNNSFFYEKYNTVKNIYFPKNTSGYFLDTDDLYKNFNYINYDNAKKKHKSQLLTESKILNQIKQRFEILKVIFEEQKIIPIIITQVEFNGLKDKDLFLVNELLKEIAIQNNFHIIKLDELAIMETGDFYDKVHTTPQGTKRISEIIYPRLKNILLKIN